MTSTGVLRTPLGNAVAARPSFVGRAPMPPEWKASTLKARAFATAAGSALTRPGPPKRYSVQLHDAPSAGTPPGSACARQPKITSGSICPTTWRTATGAGCAAFRIEPSGARMRIVASDPSLFGTAGATMHFTPNAA